jgi:site-specific DNA-methyltransferase (adenine-specific)
MRIVGACEYALLLYRERLPMFNNNGRMVKNWFRYQRDNTKYYPKIHPTQKPVYILKQLIELFTNEGDTVIDPCAGSGTTLRACMELNRNSYGFEISRDFVKKAKETILNYENNQLSLFSQFE